MSDWQPITDREAVQNHPGLLAVAWRVDMPDVGSWWEVDTDPYADCATHWMPLPEPVDA